MNSEYDYLFKLLLIGDSGVGKSCLLLRLFLAQQACAPHVPAAITVQDRTNVREFGVLARCAECL